MSVIASTTSFASLTTTEKIEVVLDGRTGFVVPPKDTGALAAAVIRFFEENRAEDFRAHIKEEDARYSWDRMVEHVDRLMKG